ncbi:MAG TPA: tetratricopeptide repeat protein [Lacunisphaera sp.]|jgi:tetratricopeptide (TPR) repeat protein
MARRPKNSPPKSTGGPHPAKPPVPAGFPNQKSAGVRSRQNLWLGLALLGLVLLAYYPAISGGFIWDDDAHLTANPCIIGPLGLKDIWTSTLMRICPLVQTTFWLEHRIWGLNPLPYHLVNILMHAAAALVLWQVLRLLRVPGAWLGAALWALHPVQVESVAWITEMKNTQSGLFFLLTIFFFCKSRQATAENKPKDRSGFYYSLTLFFAVLAMSSKSSTVVLPLVLGLCAWWMDKRWLWRRDLIPLIPVFFLSALTGVATMWTQTAEGAFDPEFALGFAGRLALAGKVVWFYAGKLIWPHPLIFIYPRWQIDAASFAAYLPTLMTTGLMIVLWWKRDRWARTPFFTMAFFIAALLPVLGLIDTFFWRYSFVGDHFQYLASMGPLALAGAGLQTVPGAMGRPGRWLVSGFCPVLLLTFSLLTWRQCAMYQNEEALWITTLERNPASWMAHNNLGILLDGQPSRSADAIFHYEEALRLKPENARAHSNLARDLGKVPGRQNDAIAHAESALRIDPNLGWAHYHLAEVLTAMPGRQAEAIAHFEQALHLMPDSAEIHSKLAFELGKIPGREAEVINHYREALRLRPDWAEAHNDFALVLAMRPDGTAEAAVHFKEALRLRPDWAEAHNNYAGLLSGQPGRMSEAIAHYEEALHLKPDAPLVHYNLAGAYYRSGRLAEAIEQLETALKLDPGYENARLNLAALRQQR